jgi:hypothetical protein
VSKHWTILYHRLIETVCRLRSQLDRSHLDIQSASRCQTRTLLGLIHRARFTSFGREHDFCRIRAPEDYRRLVPLRTLEELRRLSAPGIGQPWREGRSAGNPNGSPAPRLTLAGPQRDAFRWAVRTGLALAISRKLPRRLYSGRLLLAPPSLPAWPDRPLLLHPWGLGEAVSSRKLFRLSAETDAWREMLRHETITCLAGSVEGIVRIGQLVLEEGKDLSSVWPDLALVFCLQEDGADPSPLLAPLLGERVHLLRAVSCLEGLVALTDPRHRRLRLLTDHGLYFEFIPLEQRERVQPERRDLTGVESGRPYELVLTSPLGLWACRSDLVLTLAQVDPPLLASVEHKPLLRPTAALTSPAALADAGPAAGGHPRTAGSPAKPPETFGHTPWSVPADRG